jgi:hypothetical protein
VKENVGGSLVDPDQVELREVGEQNPGHRLLHARLLRADAVVTDVAEDLFLMRDEEVFPPVQQTLGLHEQQRPVGIPAQQVIHGVTQDSELADVVGVGDEAKRVEQRLQELLLGGFLWFLAAKAGRLQPFRLGDQPFQCDEKLLLHDRSGLVWSPARR